MSNDSIQNSLLAFIGALALVGSIFAMSQCTIKTNQQYYAAQTQCVQSGGTWIPHGDGQSSVATCFKK